MSGRNFSICLGVDRYSDPYLGDLSFASSDARRIHELVREKLHYGDRALLLPQSTNGIEFLRRLRSFLKEHEVKAHDRVVVYFAGHGMQWNANDHLLLLSEARVKPLADGRAENNDFLSVRALLDDLNQFIAEFVLILDACRQPPGAESAESVYDSVHSVLAGLTSRDMRFVFPTCDNQSSGSRSAAQAQPTRHLIVNSCSDHGRAHEVSALGHGLFACALVDWICESAAAHLPLVIDSNSVTGLGARMRSMAERAGIPVHQQPWLSRTQPGFVLYAPATDSPAKAGAVVRHESDIASQPVTARSNPRASKRSSTQSFRDVDAPWCPLVRVLGAPLNKRVPRVRLAVSVDPITTGEFLALSTGDDLRVSAKARGTLLPTGAALPVTFIVRAECDLWLDRLNMKLRESVGPGLPPYRLLNNDEWTYACTCGLTARYVIETGEVRVLDRSQAVFRYSEIDHGRRYPPSENPRAPAPVDDTRNRFNCFGLRGMHGNVRELAASAQSTLLMGGGYRSGPDMLHARSFINASQTPEADVGFRIARTLRSDEFIDD